MVQGALFLAATAGVLLSALFLYFEVGRFATPVVPRTLFDERKEFFAYTAGLFVGLALSIPFGLLVTSLPAGVLIGAIVGLVILVVGLGAAHLVLLRSTYFGRGEAAPFYVVGLDGGVAAILILTLLSIALATTDPLFIGSSVVEAVAVLVLLEAGALLAIPRVEGNQPSGGAVSSAALVGAGFLLLSVGALVGAAAEILVAVAVIITSLRTYLGLREAVLGKVSPPPPPSAEAGGPERPKFGRTDR